ncbi:MAG: ankyrin repeat domain-containing protein [Gemmatimonadales bacterium]|nr:ankyrin repeat domain-containing protein [Gemmatimonadales bacterium]
MFFRNWIIILALVLMAATATAGEIHQAIEAGDLSRVQALVRADAEVTCQPADDRDRSLPLHIAAIAGQLEIMEYLIAAGAIVEGHDTDESTPLMVACLRGQVDAARLLLRHGAVADQADLNGSTPIDFAMISGSIEVIHVLRKAGIDLAKPTPNNPTFMYPAATSGNVEMLEFLLSSGVPIDTANNAGATPLAGAAGGGKTDAVRWLLAKGADAKHVDNNGRDALSQCSFRGNGAIAELLLEAGADLNKQDRFGITRLFSSVWTSNDEVTAVLLKAGADPNLASELGQTPLIKASERGNLADVEALLAAGAKVDPVETPQGRQALHIAAARGYSDVAARLIKAGAPLNTTDNAGATPIMLASDHGNDKIAKVLAKADPASCKTTTECQLAGTIKKCASKCSGALQAAKAPAKGDARVWYLGHSSMAVQTQNNLLIFDYYENGRGADSPGLANGNISPEEIADQKVTVFASHVHGDHYDPVIFEWREQVKDITYLLGFEPNDENVPAHESIGPRESKKFGDVTVHTIASNDSGVGFMVEVDGLTIFHAGDHANRKRDMSGNYCPEIDYLVAAGYHPDLTMLPTTGCNFGDQVAVRLGIDYTLEKFGPTTFFPMHAGSNPARYVEVWDEIGPKHTQVEVVIPRDSGDWYVYNAKKEHVMN